MIDRGGIILHYGLFQACEGGHKNIELLLIEFNPEISNAGLCGACRGGNKDLVMLMIEKGANKWNLAIRNLYY